MIPSVFISSTISDLHYVRETARKVVKDFAMNPVMSDFGEIAYMGGHTAESSCYLSVKDCKLMVLIIGRRYGMLSKINPKVSVTENEFDTAQESRPYIITLVEKAVMNFKDVYDKNLRKRVAFPGMDQPSRTFSFIDKVNAASQDNGIFSFSNSEEVDRILRLQFAGLFGRLLDEKNRPEKESIKDVLSEMRGLKAALGAGASFNKGSVDEIVRGARFLLEERNVQFAKFMNAIGSLEEVIAVTKASNDFTDFLAKRHLKLEKVKNIYSSDPRELSKYQSYDSFPDPDIGRVPFSGRNMAIMEIGRLSATSFVVNEVAFEYFSGHFSEFKDRICIAMREG